MNFLKYHTFPLCLQAANTAASSGRGPATMRYCMFNMLTIGALYTQLSRKLFIRFKYSWIHWKPIDVSFAVN